MGAGFYGAGGGHLTRIVITLAVVMTLLLLRNYRHRRLQPQALWIRPVLFVILIAASAIAVPPPLTGPSLAVMALGLAIGAAIGWQRGRFTRIEVHPETHAITSRASPIGMLFILAVVGARIGLRDVTYGSRDIAGVPTAAIASALVLLVGAMLIAQSIEMWLRARDLLAQARSTTAVPVSPGNPNPPIVR